MVLGFTMTKERGEMNHDNDPRYTWLSYGTMSALGGVFWIHLFVTHEAAEPMGA